jgi:hypothetical protein
MEAERGKGNHLRPTVNSSSSVFSSISYRVIYTSSCSSVSFPNLLRCSMSCSLLLSHSLPQRCRRSAMLSTRNMLSSWSASLLMKDSCVMLPRSMCSSFYMSSASHRMVLMSSASRSMWLPTGRFMLASILFSPNMVI